MTDTKYLTQMKELPPESSDESAPKAETRKKKESNLPEQTVANGGKSTASEKEEKEVEVRPIFSAKDIILAVVNLISIGLLVFILFQLPKRAEDLRKLRTEQFLNESGVSFEFSEVERNLEKAGRLQKMFLDESGLVDFVNEVEKIKAGESAIQQVSFASQLAVKDRTGNFGIPVVVELMGTWETIDRDLQKIDKLPYLFRAANISIEPSEKEAGVLVFKYGLFLYVDEKLGKNR